MDSVAAAARANVVWVRGEAGGHLAMLYCRCKCNDDDMLLYMGIAAVWV